MSLFRGRPLGGVPLSAIDDDVLTRRNCGRNYTITPTSVLLGDNSCVVEPSMASSPVIITEGFLGGFGLGLVMGGATLPLLVKKSRTRDKRSS